MFASTKHSWVSNSPKIVSALISQFGIFTPCEYYESEFQIHRPEMHLFFSKEILKNAEPKTKTDFFMSPGQMGIFVFEFLVHAWTAFQRSGFKQKSQLL